MDRDIKQWNQCFSGGEFMRWKFFIENENGIAKIFKSVLLELTSILDWFFFFLKRRDLILRSWNLTVKYLDY